MARPDILRWKTEQAFRSMLLTKGYSVSIYTYPPGTSFPEHTHPFEKIDGVVSGTFRVVLEGTELVLSAGQAVRIPAHAVHSAEVIGDEPVVSIDASLVE